MISYKGKVGIALALPIFGQILGTIDLSALTAAATQPGKKIAAQTRHRTSGGSRPR
jgi:hypothetical protein